MKMNTVQTQQHGFHRPNIKRKASKNIYWPGSGGACVLLTSKLVKSCTGKLVVVVLPFNPSTLESDEILLGDEQGVSQWGAGDRA